MTVPVPTAYVGPTGTPVPFFGIPGLHSFSRTERSYTERTPDTMRIVSVVCVAGRESLRMVPS